MSDFAENLNFLRRESGLKTIGDFANKVGLDRSTVSRLLNGRRKPNGDHLFIIARHCGMDSDDLLLSHEIFRDIYLSNTVNSNLMIHSLSAISSNLNKCRDIFPKYEGQYIVYTNATEDGISVASLLKIIGVTKNGIEFKMINPYKRVSGEYTSFEYSGYMMPVDEFLYFIAEQDGGQYEILSMIFYGSGLPKPDLLEGLWSGIGVKDDRKYIAAVPAVVVRCKEEIDDWKAACGTKLGYIKTSSLPEVVRRKLKTDIITISR